MEFPVLGNNASSTECLKRSAPNTTKSAPTDVNDTNGTRVMARWAASQPFLYLKVADWMQYQGSNHRGCDCGECSCLNRPLHGNFYRSGSPEMPKNTGS